MENIVIKYFANISKKLSSLLCITFLFSSITFGQSAVVNKVWLEHGTQKNGNKGMTIHADINVIGMKGKKIQSIAYFYDNNKSKLLGGVRGYRTTDGQVCAFDYGTTPYENSHFADFVIFIPYNSLPLNSGKHTYYVKVNVVDTEKDIFLSDNRNYVSFTGTGDSNNSNGNHLVENEDYGTNSKHGKIIKSTSEKQGTTVVKKEWYEDGYYSIFLMDKCKACGGTGRVGYNFCTAGCAMGFLSLLTYYDPNGNEVESSGNMGALNNSYYGGGTGGSYSGGNSSGSNGGGSSAYTKCTSCNGTGRCSSCNGRGYKFNSYSGHDDSCPSCRGKGSCPICYGRGKL